MDCCKRGEGYSVKEEDNPGSTGEVAMKKQINLLHGVTILVGIIICSRMFVSPVGILQKVYSVGVSFMLWVVCGIYNRLGAVCYAELGSSIPQSGGEYVYIRRAFGDLASFICLWIDFLLICQVGIAAMGLMFAVYLFKPIYPECYVPDLPSRLLAALITTNCSERKSFEGRHALQSSWTFRMMCSFVNYAQLAGESATEGKGPVCSIKSQDTQVFQDGFTPSCIGIHVGLAIVKEDVAIPVDRELYDNDGSEEEDPFEDAEPGPLTNTCVICEIEAANILFLPCQHHIVCQFCFENLNIEICLSCGQQIEETVKTFPA